MLEGQPNLKMLVSHTLYNRPEMDFVFGDAKYVTIIREPTAQFESAFFFFKMPQELHLEQFENPIEEFMRSPEKYKNTKGFIQHKKSLNDQFRVLGLPESKFSDEWFIRYKLKQLEFEIDLVMINEYFDESLILLKKTLCWQFDDILYLSKKVRSKSNQAVLTSTLKEKIRSWNSADVLLYEHFNQTFWRRISEYGNTFFDDLNKFRKMKVASNEKCVGSFFNRSMDGRPDVKLVKVKENLSEKDKQTCIGLNKDANDFMRIMD
ncbi:galactose-3-O-sulfotransferase 3-like [Anneissia japonica]|uniref:galactose-3-O-sulfotransferase 3-like n=1 Tax=Anneissia japonica TaxID=1529436 RepID=UPI0014256C51|nr:galactose-3-O-sulfotransferase 3-like [Anneissia japonica]